MLADDGFWRAHVHNRHDGVVGPATLCQRAPVLGDGDGCLSDRRLRRRGIFGDDRRRCPDQHPRPPSWGRGDSRQRLDIDRIQPANVYQRECCDEFFRVLHGRGDDCVGGRIVKSSGRARPFKRGDLFVLRFGVELLRGGTAVDGGVRHAPGDARGARGPDPGQRFVGQHECVAQVRTAGGFWRRSDLRYLAACVSGQGAVSVSGRSSPIIMLGLVNGATYQCSLSAINSLGGDVASRSLSVAPGPSASTPARVAEFTTLDFETVVAYSRLELPAHFDGTVFALDNTPPGNAVDDKIASLGRVLFYEKRLSRNDTTSCSSCHQQENGFSDPRRFSVGFDGASFTSAHSMPLANIRFYRPGEMFWDRRSLSVENQASQPIMNAIEMGWTELAGGFSELITKLNGLGYYPDLFAFAFGTPAITEARIGRALAQFERSMISSSSRWDTGYATVFDPAAPNRNLGADLPNLSAEENRGRQLFMTGRGQGGAGCSACHLPPTFSLAANSLSNGLDAGETRIFKSASLKNVSSTAPYMHDGRFETLEQVVDFYDRGIRLGPALDNRLRQGNGAQQLGLSPADRAALVAFMRTLDDVDLTTDLRFSSPMKK